MPRSEVRAPTLNERDDWPGGLLHSSTPFLQYSNFFTLLLFVFPRRGFRGGEAFQLLTSGACRGTRYSGGFCPLPYLFIRNLYDTQTNEKKPSFSEITYLIMVTRREFNPF